MLTPSIWADLSVLGVLALIGAHLRAQFVRGRWLLFDPLNAFWLGFLFCYVYQPLAHGALLIQWHSEACFERTLLWALLSAALLLWGYESAAGAKWGLRLPAAPRRLSLGRLQAAAALLILLGVAGYAYLMNSAGGIRNWLAVSRGGTDYQQVSGYIMQLTTLLPLGVALLLFARGFAPPALVPAALTAGLAALAWAWFYYLGSRSAILSLSATFLVAFYLPRRRNPPLWLPAAAAVAVVWLVGFQVTHRHQFTDLSLHLDLVDWEESGHAAVPSLFSGAEARAARDYSRGIELDCAMTVLDLVPEPIDYNYGYCHLQILTQAIPRRWWPDKIYPHSESFTPILDEGGLSSTWIPTARRPLLMGPAFSFVGHWYAVGGPLALLLAAWVTGCCLRMIRTLYDRDPFSQGGLILYWALLPFGYGEAAATPVGWVWSLPSLVTLLIVLLLCRNPCASPS